MTHRLNVLIVGMGFSGNEYYKSLSFLAKKYQLDINFAYHDLEDKSIDIRYFNDFSVALSTHEPDLVVVAVNDEFHVDILNRLEGYRGFVVCEKPLANINDDLESLNDKLQFLSGFSFDVVERYSEIPNLLKHYIADNKLKLLRAHFTWGKNRHLDSRPTCGVISEIIHPLDMLYYLKNGTSDLKINSAIGIRSDYAINSEHLLESVFVNGEVGETVFTGYSSFVNLSRERVIQLTLATRDSELIFAKLIFDEPGWDIDTLKAWKMDNDGQKIILEHQSQKKLATNLIDKLTIKLQDVLLYVHSGHKPVIPFPTLDEAIYLQKLLNQIESQTILTSTVKYYPQSSKKNFLNSSLSVELLA